MHVLCLSEINYSLAGLQVVLNSTLYGIIGGMCHHIIILFYIPTFDLIQLESKFPLVFFEYLSVVK